MLKFHAESSPGLKFHPLGVGRCLILWVSFSLDPTISSILEQESESEFKSNQPQSKQSLADLTYYIRTVNLPQGDNSSL